MSENLVIVESPAKAKTINKYLGKEFVVLASFGHVRDLIPKGGAVDPNNQFAMQYQNIERNAKHMNEIVKAAKRASALYLATDPDREGEAIARDVCEILNERKALKDKPVHRVVFHQITKNAVKDAVDNPRALSQELVNAQQARRALDYLVGFNLSPLLWKKIRRGLSAGRVQSPALRLIVERELEIESFNSQEYWTIEADLHAQNIDFSSKLITYQHEKLQQFSITDSEAAEKAKQTLLSHADGELTVTQVKKSQRKRRPLAPFITSTLQQDAVRKLGFTAQRAMRIAQQLYEGVDVGSGSIGLITYMRTDSVNLASEAIDEIRQVITKRYGKENLPDKPVFYKTKSKNAQEAHEAIRPTQPSLDPEKIKNRLTVEQYKLYSLIWRRTIACQMIPATIHSVAVDLACGDGNLFRANGSTIADPGFMLAYQVEGDSKKDDDKILPALKEGEKVPLKAIRTEQHFTEPPPRYSEASLVKALEEYDIGRPSTYASIISTLQNREYVTLEKKRFRPTDVGRIVCKFLTNYFSKYVDYAFTAKLEDELDAVARGESEWIPLLEKFWKPFDENIHHIEETVQRKDVTQEMLDEKCPKCGEQLSIRLGRKGRFIGCTAYPDCDYTASLNSDGTEEAAAEIIADRQCPDCSSDLLIREGRYGKFIGCSNYPDCRFIEPLNKPEDTAVTCPECKDGNILKRLSRKGKVFYSCSNYPKCKYALWNAPLDEPCPNCEWPILSLKVTKRRGAEKVCPQQGCNFSEAVEDKESDN